MYVCMWLSNDEAADLPVREFLGLRFRIYGYIKDSSKDNKKAKGIKKSFGKNAIKDNNCRGSWHNKVSKFHELKVIKSVKNDRVGC